MKSPFEYVEVLLPLALEGSFTYAIPKEFQSRIQIGQRVVVSFGGKKLYTAIVYKLHNQKPEIYKTKNIVAVLDDISLVTNVQLQFWEWISAYYVCTLGEVYKNSFPSALKLESETYIRNKEGKSISYDLLDANEILVLQSLEHKSSISLKELEAFLPQNSVMTTVKSLYEEHLIEIDEKLIEKYIPKTTTYIRVHPSLQKDEKLFAQAIESLQKAEKQLQVVLALLTLESQLKKPISKKELIQYTQTTGNTIKLVCDKNILESYELQHDRMLLNDDAVSQEIKLTKAQQECLLHVENQFKQKKTVLLHGVTGSGKTEVFFELIEKQLSTGSCTVLLLPEIAITTQLIERMKLKFGAIFGIYHSKLNQQERVEVYKNCLEQKYKIIIGARSALFLPFQNVSLIIVDEEHELSYKQRDTKPYYHTKDSALMLAKLMNCNVLLSSATPSLESLYQAQNGKFGYVRLDERYKNTQLPEIQLVDLKEKQQNSLLKGSFSDTLLQAIETTISEKKQVILYQNRRGFSPIMECATCGFTHFCPNCDVTLTYHKFSKELKCHYCGYKMAMQQECPACHTSHFQSIGNGTQQVEEELKSYFPTARIFRMDSDTMRSKNAYEKLLEKMYAKEIDILVGTQMVTKGLDFKDVQLVGVLKADSLLNQPDFRSQERAFQQLTQVSGRAGRREKGTVLIQTYNPQHIVFESVIQHRSDALVPVLLQERKEFWYPPFVRLIEITFKHKDKTKAEKCAVHFTEAIRKVLPLPYSLGPEPALIPRINNVYSYQTLLKIVNTSSLPELKDWLKTLLKHKDEIALFKAVKIEIDVDPH